MMTENNDSNKKQAIDAKDINAKLCENAETFYSALLGEPTQKSDTSWRFGKSGSLSVTLAGNKRGCWYSFEFGQGGGPIKLLENEAVGLGLSFKEALARATAMAGIATPEESDAQKKKTITKASDKDKKNQDRIKRAQYYMGQSESAQGTLAECYLREHRGITCSLQQMYYHPSVRDISSHHAPKHYPALLVAAINEFGEIQACHTILLDPITGKKADVRTQKVSRGVVKGAVVPIHSGDDGNIIICEGIETGLSIASCDSTATVYVTLGNLANALELAWVVKKHKATHVTIAMDNDGDNPAAMVSLEKITQAFNKEHGISVDYFMPELLNDGKKRDCNDVLLQEGRNALTQLMKERRSIQVESTSTTEGDHHE